MRKTRIILAEDHAVVREGLKLLINGQKDMTVIAEAGDGRTALELVTRLHPDILVTDISMPDLNGALLSESIKQSSPRVKIVALTVHEDRAYLERLIRAGVSGYVLKRAASKDLIEALRKVAGGGSYLDPNVAGTLFEAVGKRHPTKSPLQALTEREAAVLKLIAEAYTNKEIANQLAVTVKTIETHKARAMQKLALKSRAELVRYALDKGWLQGS